MLVSTLLQHYGNLVLSEICIFKLKNKEVQNLWIIEASAVLSLSEVA